jgi:hypothetical protein
MTPLQLRLFNRLDRMQYNRRNASRFKSVVFRLERTIKKYHDPHCRILRGLPLMKRYLHTKNYTDRFEITTKRYTIRGLRRSEILIPVHVSNLIHGKGHFIMFMVKGKNIYRIDPTFESHSHIWDRNVKKAVQGFFKGYHYKGYPKWNKNITHGGLCRWVTPLIYKYHKRLSYSILKKEIMCYFLKLIK